MVSSPSLDETLDVEKLIPGSHSALRSTTFALADAASDFILMAGMLNQVEVAGWKGAAADQFRKKWHDLPESWSAASKAYGNAREALAEYEIAFDTARSAAEDAVILYRRGRELTKNALVDFHTDQAARAAEQAGKPYVPGPKSVALGQGFHDPGEYLRREAHQNLDDARAQLHRSGQTAALTIVDGAALAPKAPPTGWDQFWGGVNGVVEFPGNVVEGFLLAGWDTIASSWNTSPARWILELVFSGSDATWKDLMTQGETGAATVLAITKDPIGSLGKLVGDALDLKEWGTNPGHVIGHALFFVAGFAVPGAEVAAAGKAATVGGDAEKLLLDGSKVTDLAAEAARRNPLTGNRADGSWVGEKLRLDAPDNAMVQQYAADAVTAETRIRPGLQSLLEGGSLDAHLVGLDDSVKFANSLKLKVAEMLRKNPDLTVEGALKEVRDSVRYTAEIPDATYSGTVTTTIEGMKAQGYQMVLKPGSNPNRWVGNGYKGINTSWIDPTTGRTFEFQFHSPESFAMKTQTHPLYEALKVPGISRRTRTKLQSKSDAMFATVPVPPGVSDLDFPMGG